jgi:hypothetical protein
MPYETDERLKGYLDTNQLHREQLCLSVLAIDKRFSDVRPRHPRGGPDGARDIDAVYQGEQRVFGAVGFVNQANDSDEHKKKASKKFRSDLTEALQQDPAPAVFVFFTNVNLGVGEKDKLIKYAKGQTLAHAEIFDRERIRIALDSADGLSLRFQYLQIPLSEAEQASFFARWGDDIQSMISSGFGAIEKSLNRIHFLQEAMLPLTHLSAVLGLDKEYSGIEIGHFRAFALFRYITPIQNVLSIMFGSSDNSERQDARSAADLSRGRSGIAYSICAAQWDQRVPEPEDGPSSVGTLKEPQDEVTDEFYFQKVGSSSSVGRDRVKGININYNKSTFLRIDSGPCLMDLNESIFIFILNKRLAEKVNFIRVFANEYKLADITKDRFYIDETPWDTKLPFIFSADELADPWVRLRPKNASAFRIDFSEQTPRRFYDAIEISNETI